MSFIYYGSSKTANLRFAAFRTPDGHVLEKCPICPFLSQTARPAKCTLARLRSCSLSPCLCVCLSWLWQISDTLLMTDVLFWQFSRSPTRHLFDVIIQLTTSRTQYKKSLMLMQIRKWRSSEYFLQEAIKTLFVEVMRFSLYCPVLLTLTKLKSCPWCVNFSHSITRLDKNYITA